MKKGQDAGQWLIILAVIIVLALITVAILGGIPHVGNYDKMHNQTIAQSWTEEKQCLEWNGTLNIQIKMFDEISGEPQYGFFLNESNKIYANAEYINNNSIAQFYKPLSYTLQDIVIMYDTVDITNMANKKMKSAILYDTNISNMDYLEFEVHSNAYHDGVKNPYMRLLTVFENTKCIKYEKVMVLVK